MKIDVAYMSAAGNIFAVVDNKDNLLSESNLTDLAKELCSKSSNREMDTEGLMLLEESKNYDFECKFFNPDGSTGMMCGNGGRAIVRFASSVKHIDKEKDTIRFFMANDIYEAKFLDDNIDLTMAEVKFEHEKQLSIDNKVINTYFVDNGSQHIVINIDEFDLKDINKIDINDLGKKVRFNSELEPVGANANFYSFSDGFVNLRTYERGVEKETGACGTGAVATAIAAHRDLGIEFPIHIIPTSNDKLSIDKQILKGNKIYHLIGPAKILKTSTFELNK
jgi:diaminopimelate epimerase